MQPTRFLLVPIIFIFLTTLMFSQEENNRGSVIQTLTPSKLIAKGQWDIKWFNNLYTQDESTFSEGTEPRETFFTSTLEGFAGIDVNRRWNIGVILEFRSNVIADRDVFDVFSFDGDRGTARSGLTGIAPAVKFVPLKNIGNFSIQSAFFFPLFDNETEDGVFLDQDSFIWQNRFFYDHTFPGDQFQLFTELNSELNVGDGSDSFANNSIRLTPGVFFSYFPTSTFTVLALVQHSQLIALTNNFAQDFTAVGGGAKYQLTRHLNLELLYTRFVRGTNTGLGQTYNLGVRAVF